MPLSPGLNVLGLDVGAMDCIHSAELLPCCDTESGRVGRWNPVVGYAGMDAFNRKGGGASLSLSTDSRLARRLTAEGDLIMGDLFMGDDPIMGDLLVGDDPLTRRVYCGAMSANSDDERGAGLCCSVTIAIGSRPENDGREAVRVSGN